MSRTIVVATDFSDVSQDAFPFAVDLAERLDAELVLTHVIPALPRLMAANLPRLSGYEDAMAEQAQIELDKLAAAIAVKGHTVRTHLSKDPPAALAILDTARDTNASLVVIANHGRRGAARVLLGSVTEEVLRRSKVPVLTVCSEAKMWSAGQRMLVPVDFSASSAPVLKAAARLARVTDLVVHLVHIVAPLQSVAVAQAMPESALIPSNPEQRGDQRHEQRESALAKELERLAYAAGLEDKFQISIAHGDPDDRILDLSRSLSAALIVIGSHGRRGLGRAVLGSVAEGVVRGARCPTLVVKSDKGLNEWPGRAAHL